LDLATLLLLEEEDDGHSTLLCTLFNADTQCLLDQPSRRLTSVFDQAQTLKFDLLALNVAGQPHNSVCYCPPDMPSSWIACARSLGLDLVPPRHVDLLSTMTIADLNQRLATSGITLAAFPPPNDGKTTPLASLEGVMMTF
jgi:hypothetical protein